MTQFAQQMETEFNSKPCNQVLQGGNLFKKKKKFKTTMQMRTVLSAQ